MRAKLLSNGPCSVCLVADVPTVPNPSHAVFGLICIVQPFKGICLICILLIKDVVLKKHEMRKWF